MKHTLAKKSEVRRCRWCKKIIKPYKDCWFQVYCTGGQCRYFYTRDKLKRGRDLLKKAEAG